MCHRLSTAFVLVLSLFIGANRAAAQAQTTASIIGQVTDESGAVLPGVTVTATSPALQVPQVAAVTDAQGDYRLSPLPIGTYEVTYTLTGFQTVRRDSLRLTGGFVAKVDVPTENRRNPGVGYRLCHADHRRPVERPGNSAHERDARDRSLEPRGTDHLDEPVSLCALAE